MSYQSEAELENQLIDKLTSVLGYKYVKIDNEAGLESNLRTQLNRLNHKNLNGKSLSDKEFERLMIYLKGKSIFQSSKQLRDKFQLQRDDSTYVYLNFIDFEDKSNNEFEVSHQITMDGPETKYDCRFDVTILLNGFPVTQIELKRRGIHIKKAFNQMERYSRHSYTGLFRYLQLMIISNGTDTKYFSNTDQTFKYEFTFHWSDENNNRITNLNDFTDTFLKRKHLLEMIDTFMVLNETDKAMMVFRPYQVYATQGIVKRALETANSGYCWHATGSGKTLTSFKVSQILAREESIEKVLFVVDRNDLDTQTMSEFNKFEKGSVDGTDNTYTLVKQMGDVNNKMIITTVQKLNNAVKNPRYAKIMNQYRDKKVVIIVDECHRTQFGKMNTRIKKFFEKSQFFGFTGTPRFEANKSEDGRTTADVFGKCIHSYMTKDAIHDNNVLGFSIEYIETFKGDFDTDSKEKVYEIDTKEVMESPERISMIANHIVENHDRKTFNRKYNALFATPNIQMLINYYNEFKALDTDLKIAGIFSFETNQDLSGDKKHTRETLDEMMTDYNNMFGTSYDTSSYGAYRNDVSKRLKNGSLDIVIVVKIFLTGFDSKTTNTIYVDKKLKYHDLLQAFSRTNRVHDRQKIWGNVVSYRDLKDETDTAIKLFNDSDHADDVLQKNYSYYVDSFKKNIQSVREVAKTPADVDKLYAEVDEKKFIVNFKGAAQDLLALRSFVDFDFTEDEIGIDELTFVDYRVKYTDIYQKHQTRRDLEKVSILDDIDFEINLMQTDRINTEYIINLIKDIDRYDMKAQEKDIKKIKDELSRTDNPKLKMKVDLIESFLDNRFPYLDPDEDADTALMSYEDLAREKEIKDFAKKYGIDEDFLRGHISEFEFTEYIDSEQLNKDIRKPYREKRTIVRALIDFVTNNVYKYER